MDIQHLQQLKGLLNAFAEELAKEGYVFDGFSGDVDVLEFFNFLIDEQIERQR
jgi:hypothetical protein